MLHWTSIGLHVDFNKHSKIFVHKETKSFYYWTKTITIFNTWFVITEARPLLWGSIKLFICSSYFWEVQKLAILVWKTPCMRIVKLFMYYILILKKVSYSFYCQNEYSLHYPPEYISGYEPNKSKNSSIWNRGRGNVGRLCSAKGKLIISSFDSVDISKVY